MHNLNRVLIWKKGKNMQIQRCSAVNCNTRSNSAQKVNFKAVQEINTNNFYLRGIKEPLVSKAVSRLLTIFGDKDVVLYTEGNKFGVKFPGSNPMPKSRPFDVNSPKDFVSQVSDLGSQLAGDLQVLA